MKQYHDFIFEDYNFDQATKTAHLDYSFDGEVRFREIWTFDFDLTPNVNQEALNQALQGLWLIAGISYYKAALPPGIQMAKGGLSSDQAKFFSKVYQLGLGEFKYRNQLDPFAAITFPNADATVHPVALPNLKGAIVPIGGGKDSLLTTDLMNSSQQEFVTWANNQSERFAPMIARIGKPHLATTRTLDPQLLELNAQGAYNGHVPITAILAFAGVVCQVLTGRRDLILSNEASADEPTVVYQGKAINHQYSKSLDFETDFEQYVHANVSSDLRVFSLLRPLTELAIAENFVTHGLMSFGGAFSSCNRNYALHAKPGMHWCGECPKCAFVFLLFASFVPKADLIKLFDGHNPLAEPKLKHLYAEILGLADQKPFECVGEIAEARLALQMAQKSGDYPELADYDFADENYDYQAWRTHTIPDDYADLLKHYLDLSKSL